MPHHQLKAAVQENTGKTYEKFDAATCKSQVVAGTNYRVKVAVDDGFVHIAFFAPLPHTGADPELKSVEAGKTADDEL